MSSIDPIPNEPDQTEPVPTEPVPTKQIVLTAAEARCLGALIEKEATTPDYYPLSMNALMNACNQRSNREPVMDLDEEDVRQALHGLEDYRLAGRARGADGRVTKYEHWLGEAFNFSRAEMALICVLLLRGGRPRANCAAARNVCIASMRSVTCWRGLQKLMDRQPALVAVLPRQPGTKESRYTHLLSGNAESAIAAEVAGWARERGSGSDAAVDPALIDRVAQLEAANLELKQEMATLRRKIDDLFGD